VGSPYTGNAVAVIYAAGAPNGVGPAAPFTFKANDKIRLSGNLFYPAL